MEMVPYTGVHPMQSEEKRCRAIMKGEQKAEINDDHDLWIMLHAEQHLTQRMKDDMKDWKERVATAIYNYHEEAANRKRNCRILSLDGGGIRGYMTIRILQVLIKRFRERNSDMVVPDGSSASSFFQSQFASKVDYFVGTSIGGLISFCLAVDFPLDNVQQIYAVGDKYFVKTHLRRRLYFTATILLLYIVYMILESKQKISKRKFTLLTIPILPALLKICFKLRSSQKKEIGGVGSQGSQGVGSQILRRFPIMIPLPWKGTSSKFDRSMLFLLVLGLVFLGYEFQAHIDWLMAYLGPGQPFFQSKFHSDAIHKKIDSILEQVWHAKKRDSKEQMAEYDRSKFTLKQLKQHFLGKRTLVINAFDCTDNVSRVFNSGSREQDDFLVHDILKSTIAAPTFFPIYKMEGESPLAGHRMVDGGIFANDPELTGLWAARMTTKTLNHYRLLSIGTGSFHRMLSPQMNGGVRDWIFDNGRLISTITQPIFHRECCVPARVFLQYSPLQAQLRPAN